MDSAVEVVTRGDRARLPAGPVGQRWTLAGSVALYTGRVTPVAVLAVCWGLVRRVATSGDFTVMSAFS